MSNFFKMHAESNHVEIVSDFYTDDCYEKADKYMIDDSDMLLVVGNTAKKCYGAGYACGKKIKTEKLNLEKY